MKNHVEKEVKKLCSLGVLQPCTNANIDWASPHVVSWRKKEKIRLCCDLREVNKAIKKDPYPLPNIESTINSITIAKVYLVIDLSNAYHQLPVDSKTQRRLGFILPCGLYKFLRAPFGLRDVSPKFQKMMDIFLADLKGCFSYLDDIIVYGSTKEEHDESLNAVLNRLQSNGLVANFDKCAFEKTNIEWLGLKVGLNEFVILENTLTSIAEMKVSDKQSLASALGLFSHYRKLLPSNYSSKAAELYNLLQKNVFFKWTEGLTEQFKCLQKCYFALNLWQGKI